MPGSYSDNAILTKVRSLYGRRLSAADYTALLQKRSVSELASFLKNETHYAETLTEVKEDLVHREQLESLVNRHILDIYLRLMHYSYGDKFFLKIYIMQNEIRQIIAAMRCLNAGEMDKFIISMPGYMAKLMSFDLFAIAGVKDYDDLLEILRCSEYYPIVLKFRPMSQDRQIDITSCEAALLTHCFSRLIAVVEASYSGETRQSLQKLLGFQIDFHNLSLIYRLKKYYRKRPEEIRSKLIAVKSLFPAKLYETALAAVTPEDYLHMVGRLNIFRRFPVDEYSTSEHFITQTQKVQRHLYQKAFRFSGKPVVAVVCYMILLEIEVSNITNIIEGVRYKVPPDEIRSMLVY